MMAIITILIVGIGFGIAFTITFLWWAVKKNDKKTIKIRVK